jgi:hypothetical protein
MAVGYYVTSTNQANTLIASWDGTAWSVVPSPNEGSVGIDSVSSISCVSTSSCTAAGDFNNGTVVQTLIETLKGTTWSVVSSPDSSASDANALYGVSCPMGGTCTAVGLFEKGNGPGPAQALFTHDVPAS